MNLFICGSRAITFKEWVYSKIEECIAENSWQDITLLEGEAKGVDLIAKEWALEHDITVKEYPPDYEKYKDQACYIRNEEMVRDCDFMLALWNGFSTGTFHDILMAEKYHKPYKLYLCSFNPAYIEATDYVLKNHKELFHSSLNIRAIRIKFQSLVNQTLSNRIAEKTNVCMPDPWWEEGHNPSSYFWIYPMKKYKDKNIKYGDENYSCLKEQISIEEDVVYNHLYHQFLKPFFDKTIEYNCRVHSYSPEDEIKFDFYDYNLYTYDTVRKIVQEMKTYSQLDCLNEAEKEFYSSLADRLTLMMERQPDWDYIAFEGP